MFQTPNIMILGAGKIGRAVYRLLAHLTSLKEPNNAFYGAKVSILDKDVNVLFIGGGRVFDVAASPSEALAGILKAQGTTHVINALPFFLNVKVATAAVNAGCHYLDFTEDDAAAAAVSTLYGGSGLLCAPKCGLAPGFINYVGSQLVRALMAQGIVDFDHLKVRVGALPRNVSYAADNPANSYALSWSVDGLVNEYLRPCQIKVNGERLEVNPLGGEEVIVINGMQYEARYTSGGVGSLIQDFELIPNIDYKTIRYPGHYSYVIQAVAEANRDFNALKARFERDLAWTTDDVVVVYAEARGRDANGHPHVKTFAERYMGTAFGTGIEVTTAGGLLAVLELMLRQNHFTTSNNIIRHRDVDLDSLVKTEAFKLTYARAKCS